MIVFECILYIIFCFFLFLFSIFASKFQISFIIWN